MIRLALFSLALAAFVPAAIADMYKWVDEKGVTHYSESPPPDGKATKMETKPAGPAEASSAAPESWKQRELESRRKRLKEESDKATEDDHAAARKRRCLRAQRELDIVQAARPVYTVNERGEKVYLEDKDRAREIEAWKKHVQTYCD
jgi:hypothetical protein